MFPVMRDSDFNLGRISDRSDFRSEAYKLIPPPK